MSYKLLFLTSAIFHKRIIFIPLKRFTELNLDLLVFQNSKLNASKAGHEHIPTKIIKEFSFELVEPLSKIFYASLEVGRFSSVWKTAAIMPVSKLKNPASANELRPIALKSWVGYLNNF